LKRSISLFVVIPFLLSLSICFQPYGTHERAYSLLLSSTVFVFVLHWHLFVVATFVLYTPPGYFSTYLVLHSLHTVLNPGRIMATEELMSCRIFQLLLFCYTCLLSLLYDARFACFSSYPGCRELMEKSSCSHLFLFISLVSNLGVYILLRPCGDGALCIWSRMFLSCICGDAKGSEARCLVLYVDDRGDGGLIYTCHVPMGKSLVTTTLSLVPCDDENFCVKEINSLFIGYKTRTLHLLTRPPSLAKPTFLATAIHNDTFFFQVAFFYFSLFFSSKQIHSAAISAISTPGATVTAYVCCPKNMSLPLRYLRLM
jgi:hypothetical protein